jgi:prepilin-type N-terminal cleavage/methylation domain-containing protein
MTDPKTNREAGFTLLEVLVATTLMLVILAATLGTLTDAIHATEGVTLMADTQENLRGTLCRPAKGCRNQESRYRIRAV